jgi:xanthine dehydrogenase accessory factor
MRDILSVVQAWRQQGKKTALATVVHTQGSAPRPTGARLAVSDGEEMVGSVSGGCVENDVFLHALKVLESGQPELVRYAITDDMVWDVGLACGGAIDVWVERLPDTNPTSLEGGEGSIQLRLEGEIGAGRTIAQAILLEGGGQPGARMLIWPSGEKSGRLGEQRLEHQVARDAYAMMDHPRSETRTYATPAARVFIEVIPPPHHLVIFGGVHIAIPLSEMARTLGYRISIVDPRKKFADHERFPYADEIIAEWPQQAIEHIEIGPSTSCVVLTHDPKIDEPALFHLLNTSAGYIGAIGSRKTHAERFERMARLGVDRRTLAQVYAPIGLDLGAETPEEIALAIMAEIVAVRRDAPGGFMRDEYTLEKNQIR